MGSPAPKKPPIPAPQATPQVGKDTEDLAVKKQRRKSGYEKTLLTGGLSPSAGKKTTLGG